MLAEVLLADALPHLRVASAGTLVVEGHPISWRTRAGFEAIEVPAPNHRGRQLDLAMAAPARLVLAAAPEHIGWVRRRMPEIAHKTVTIKRLLHEVHTHPETTSVEALLAAVDPAGLVVEDWEEIVDPGGGEVEDYIACAHEIVALVDELAPLLAPRFTPPAAG